MDTDRCKVYTGSCVGSLLWALRRLKKATKFSFLYTQVWDCSMSDMLPNAYHNFLLRSNLHDLQDRRQKQQQHMVSHARECKGTVARTRSYKGNIAFLLYSKHFVANSIPWYIFLMDSEVQFGFK